MQPRQARGTSLQIALGTSWFGALALVAAQWSCAVTTFVHVDSGHLPPDETVTNEGVDKVDLLLMVDNSGSMRENQSNLMAQFQAMIVSSVHQGTAPRPHECATRRPLSELTPDV